MAGQSASCFDDQDSANASFIKNREHEVKKLSDEIAGMLKSLNRPSASSPKHFCIYKVSNHIRKSNEEAYTPQVISIGPFHRDNPKLQKMEDFKLRYLKSFTDRAEKIVEEIVSTIKGAEGRVRECYSENIPLESDDFVKMILVDASFIIEYFWKNKSNVKWTEYDREILEPWLCNRMQMDFILLENQLPFFIIDKIYDTAFPSLKNKDPFIELCFSQFEYYNVQNFAHKDPGSSEISILHFTDLLRYFCMPPPDRLPKGRSSENMKEMYSAAQLYEVGLKFKKRESSKIKWSPLELKYADGVLEIPPFQLDSTTEICARNLVAFEEFHYHKDPYITDYYILLSMLIKTVKDMDVLVGVKDMDVFAGEQIIDNWLDGEVATSMINKLSGEKRSYFLVNSHYHEMANGLNKFYDNYPKHIALRRALFRTRLTRATTISASFYFILSLVQATCSVLSLKHF